MKLNKKKYLSIAVLSAFAGQTFAAGLERTPQAIDALFEAGTYAEISYAHISPDIQGKDTSGNHVPNLTDDFQSFGYAVKTDLSPDFRLAVIYDEPYGAKVEFKGDNNFTDPNLLGGDGNTRAEVNSKNITTLLGYNLNKNFMIYGGPAIQDIEATLSLRGDSMGPANGYNLSFEDDMAVGWVAGMSYAKPELGILASLTYRSEVEHKTNITEDFPLAGVFGQTEKGTLTMPESVNLNLQTGINPTSVLFAKVRWVPWSDFAFYPPTLKAITGGLPILDYSDDQTAVELGLGKLVTPKLALSVSGSWDSGSGNPVTTLGPAEGYWGAGLAARYYFNEHMAFSMGGRYMWFGDAKGITSDGRVVGDYQNNDGYVVGMKLSYQTK